MRAVERPTYMNWLASHIGTPVVKVLTGIRRAGKSTLLTALAEQLRTSPDTGPVVHLDFDLFENFHLATAPALHSYLRAAAPNGRYHLLLDEVQEVDGWERLVNSLVAEGRADIYLTGSNSRLLSSELGTYLTGRYVSIEVATLSFREHLEFASTLRGRDPEAIQTEFQAYLRRGGFPGLYLADYSDSQAAQITSDIFNSILTRDVLTRHPVRQPEMFERVCRFALDSVGSPLSARSIARYMKAQQRPISHPTVAEYFDYLTEAYLLTRVPRYDLRGRDLLATNEKYYAGDHGMITALLGADDSRLPGLLENVVAAELARRGYRVAVGKQGEAEVDFVADRRAERIYVQVATSILDQTTRTREFAPLAAISDAHPKYVVSLDTLEPSNTDGIRRMPVPDFLLADTW
ncbi:MAG: ATP-binding protein [Bifidobacteriaceae bacterium]|jgi:predicted AAA+ superfamily ATPase|nr:ATP-binding protein [Bifidobacteriaceae bacterium]